MRKRNSLNLDEVVGWRICLKCGTIYRGKHLKCPHKNVKGHMETKDLFEVINIGDTT